MGRLTPEQDLLVRSFYEEIANGPDELYQNVNTSRGTAMGVCLALLGYVLVKGKHVKLEKYQAAKVPYGMDPAEAFEDEYNTDKEEIYAQLSYDNSRWAKADSGKSSEGTPVWKTLFRKDI